MKLSLCGKRVIEYNPLLRYVPRRGPKVALVYPAPYSVASQSLGFQLVYALLIAHGISVERFTWDSCGRSLERGTPLKKFKYVISSLSFELDYPYLAKMLKDYGNEEQKVIAGGLSVTANPIPVLDMVDYVVLGDAEPTIPKLAQMIFEDDLREEEWLVGESGKKAIADIAEEPMLSKQFLPLSVDPPWGKGFLVEVTRGCPHRCRFCLEGWVSKPFRERRIEQIERTLEEVGNPFEKIITISLSLSDYGKYKKYLEILANHKLQGSVPSLRVEGIDEELLDMIKRMGQRTVTLAPETSVKEKAKVLGKGFAAKYLKEKIEMILSRKLKPKLYFMVLPNENVENEINNVKRIVKSQAHLSVNPLIPKPWTPLQIAPIPGEREEKALRRFKESFPNVDVYPVKWARLQAVIGLSQEPVMRYLDPSLSPERQVEELSKVISLKELMSWRPQWWPKWMRYEISNESEVIELGQESYEAWMRAFRG